MASLTRWTWVWESFRSWWWTWKPGMLQSVESQRFGHNWVTEVTPAKKQSSSDFMAAVTIHSDFRAQEEEICDFFHLSPFYFPWSNGAGCSTWVQKWQNDLFLRQAIQHHSNLSLCPFHQSQGSWSWSVLWRPRRPRTNTKKDILFIIGDWNAEV